MAAEIRQFYCTIPAGTAQAAPVARSLRFPVREVERVQIRVPAGPAGQVGFALQVSGVTIIPYDSAAFIVAEDEYLDWDLRGYPNSGDWRLIGYNTGLYDHTLSVRFLLALVARKPAPPPPVPDLVGMTGGVALGGADLAAAAAAEDQVA